MEPEWSYHSAACLGGNMRAESNAIKDQIREFVWDYSGSKGMPAPADDELLIKQNTINSLGVFRLISFLEDSFPIVIEDTDILPENFQTINDIEAFVLRKMVVESGELVAGALGAEASAVPALASH
jgi:acyl carrier protein